MEKNYPEAGECEQRDLLLLFSSIPSIIKPYQRTRNKMPDKNNNSDNKSQFKKMLAMSSIGLVLPTSIAIGLFIGYYLDKWLHTHPWMLIIFLLFGVISGFVSLFRELNRLKDENGN